jgi:hypothetical protein
MSFPQVPLQLVSNPSCTSTGLASQALRNWRQEIFNPNISTSTRSTVQLLASVHNPISPRPLARPRQDRQVTKSVLITDTAIDRDRRVQCSCVDGICCTRKLDEGMSTKCLHTCILINNCPAGAQYRIRKYLKGLSQDAEAKWRKGILNSDSVLFGSPRRIFWEKKEFCLGGFATFVGGPHYIKNCLRTIQSCLLDSTSAENRRIPSSIDRQAEADDAELRESFRETTTSASTFAARRYISEFLEELVLFDPVTGQKVVTEVTVQEVFRRYADDARETFEIHVVSATQFRLVWDDIVKTGLYVIRSPRRVHKCDMCLELNSETRKVCV